MKKRLILGSVLFAVAAVIVFGSSFVASVDAAATAPVGSYTETCRAIVLEGTAPNSPGYLKASCRKADGSWQDTQLKYDIANCNGNLTWAPNGC